MDVVKEVKLLKYQMRLMKHMINSDEHFFFMFAIDHEFEEEQVNVLLKILHVLNNRLKGEEISVFYQNDHLFSQFNLPLDKIYSTQQPTLEEFNLYIAKIFYQEFELEYLLSSLKKQAIQNEICDFFLNLL
ncbi:DUF1878 family protein [Priestia megaterium]|uniref:DUF1878 family protein n=1 Tax=Priestia megaterium TaxID=1404 RepID=UPI001BE67FB5|nr:DUF1878 family protein [Priestia megaterium]MBT2259584.1 DUF1878 family protein [Priestia megaterium]MBT2281220.1 DUF1878 family protein [Priestia megaterium]